jgi:hypothetical protein
MTSFSKWARTTVDLPREPFFTIPMALAMFGNSSMPCCLSTRKRKSYSFTRDRRKAYSSISISPSSNGNTEGNCQIYLTFGHLRKPTKTYLSNLILNHIIQSRIIMNFSIRLRALTLLVAKIANVLYIEMVFDHS